MNAVCYATVDTSVAIPLGINERTTAVLDERSDIEVDEDEHHCCSLSYRFAPLRDLHCGEHGGWRSLISIQ